MEDDKNSNIKNNKIDTDYDEECERKYPPLFLLILITTVGVLAALGLSFSTIKYIESNETINTIISNIKGDDDKDRYVITYAENTGAYSGGINLINQYPTPDSRGKLFEGENYVYNFSLIIGKKTKGAYYELTVVPNRTNTLKGEFVKIYLEKNDKEVDFSYKKNRKVKVYTDYLNSEYKGTQGKVIYKGVIDEDDVKKGKIDFTMRMWVSEDALVDDNFYDKTFGVKVNTYATFKKG